VSDQRNRLAVELEFYKVHLSEWLPQHSGDYVVAKGTEVLGFYREFGAAYSAGVRACGFDVDFLVKQVLEFEPVYSVFWAAVF